MKKLLSSYPHLVKEWHPTKNGELTPNDFTHGSKKKVWWLCPEGHSYDATPNHRTQKNPRGCPYCSGNKVGEDNNLLFLFPEVAKEWHPTKNGELTPNEFTYGSKKKVWWLCPEGHSYETSIGGRTGNQRGCSYCAGKKVSEDNNLLFLFPEIAKEWHPTKNGELTPNNFTHGSKKKVWWLCSKGHSYESNINNRIANQSGCSYCAGKKVSEDNNLLRLYPEITKEWHPTKNKGLTPKQVTSKSSEKVWWLCPKGHSYESAIAKRTDDNPRGCPYCSGNKVGEDNNLLFLFPEVAKEWHPTKNKELTPNQVTSGSGKKVWWLCPKGHSYNSGIHSRTNRNSGCPKCSNQSSQPEIRILSELKWFFDEVNSRYKVDGVEIDIFLPNFNIGIEYDGNYWHKDKKDKDLEKNKFLLSQDIHLIRVREHPLKSLSENDIVVSNYSLTKTDLDNILKKIVPFVDNNIKEKINAYLVKSSFVNEELFKEFRSYFPSPFPEHSLLKRHPLISSEWDYDKNYL